MTNETLYAALLALVEIGQAQKPMQAADGRREGPALKFPGDVTLAFALARNSLKPIGEAIEEGLAACREEHRINVLRGMEIVQEDVTEPAKRRELVKAYRAARDRLMKESHDWTVPKRLTAAAIEKYELSSEWLAALMAAGIVTDGTEARPTAD